MSKTEQQPLRVLAWGTYDLGKPRTRIMLEAIRHSGAALTEIHVPVWEGTEDKSVLTKAESLKRALLWASAYPRLVWRFLRAPCPDVVVIGYLGHLDVLILWPFAKLKRVPIVWDAFLSLYDTVVDDRQMVSPRHPLAYLLRGWEWLACRAADLVVLDTDAQADLFRGLHGLRHDKVTSVPVGAEVEVFPQTTASQSKSRATVLFYGQFIPLHGIETIIEAARRSADHNLDWVIIGTGQQAPAIREMLSNNRPAHLTWEEWVPYKELAQRIARADVCLGVFGSSEKAGRVIPNKVFQILSAGRPLVTRDGPGIRELVADGAPGIELIPPSDPGALIAAVERMLAQAPFAPDLHADLRQLFSVDALADQWNNNLRRAENS